MTTAANTIAQLTEQIARVGRYEKCERTAYPVTHNEKGHKYEVRTVTTKLIGDTDYKRTGVFYVGSIAQLENSIRQDAEYMRRNYAGFYTSIKNGFETAYYVTRVY